MRISDWSSDVCSSDLTVLRHAQGERDWSPKRAPPPRARPSRPPPRRRNSPGRATVRATARRPSRSAESPAARRRPRRTRPRSEEHTSELQSLMRISYAVFCLKKKNTKQKRKHSTNQTTEQQN